MALSNTQFAMNSAEKEVKPFSPHLVASVNHQDANWFDSRSLPAVVSVASFLLLVLQIYLSRRSDDWKIDKAKSRRTATLRGLRVITTATLFALVVFGTSASVLSTQDKSLHVVLCIALGYALVLTILSATPRYWTSPLSAHVTTILLSYFAVYTYRNVWPLMTFTMHPVDSGEGAVLWIKIALAGFTSLVVPILEPYPALVEDESTGTSPEETSSLLSFLSFQFMQPTIAKAMQAPHLPPNELPPLNHTDRIQGLSTRTAKYLDPYATGQRNDVNLHFGIFYAFLPAWILSGTMIVGMVLAELTGPVATNRLLYYLENEGQDALIRPWVWLVIIGLGPWLMGVFGEMHNYYGGVISVQLRAALTALIFEHALRVRVTSEQDQTGSTSSSSADDAQDARGEYSAPAVTPDTGHLVGRINNLATSDQANIISACNEILSCILLPVVSVSSALAFLYLILGWSAFVGLAVMVVLVPVPGWLAGRMQGVMGAKAKATDSRVGTISETMSVIRMIKMFGWETRMQQDIADQRDNELRLLWKEKLAQLSLEIVNHIVPLLHVVVTYGAYTFLQKKTISASIIFGSLRGFHMVRNQIFTISGRLPGIVRGHVSLRRLEEFLAKSQLIDGFVPTNSPPEVTVDTIRTDEPTWFGFRDAMFTWSNAKVEGTQTSSLNFFRLAVKGDVMFEKDSLTLVIGPTGSGKTSLLMALLGEMRYTPLQDGSWFNLPRHGGVAFAPQESWVLNATIKDNVVFGSAFNESRYRQVIKACALERDLELFESGDNTEVGEKGLTLSGGQKARVTLARAVYSTAGILLLDDIFAALDVHTSRWIVEKCFKSELIRGRTVILVTHHAVLLTPIAGSVVTLSSGGNVTMEHRVKDILIDGQVDIPESKETDKEEDVENDNSQATDTQQVEAGKLIVAEEVVLGGVAWPAWTLLINAMGGRWSAVFWMLCLLGYVLNQLADSAQVWWLGWWAEQYDLHPSETVNSQFYLSIYACIVFSASAAFILSTLVFAFGTLRASNRIHERLVASLLRSTFRWLDTTPSSRIIARCTQDIQAVDAGIPSMLSMFLDMSITLVIKLGAVALVTPAFLIPGIAFFFVTYWLSSVLRRALLPVKRELSHAQAPILASMDSVFHGLTSIRAFSAQELFRQQLYSRINAYSRVAVARRNLGLWFSMRMNTFSNIFSAALGFYLVYGSSRISPSNIGFTLTQGAAFTDIIMWWIWVFNALLVEANSLERILMYLGIDQEATPSEAIKPPAYWPAGGDLHVEKLCARYSLDGPPVLHNVSFDVRSGERIGIVGRTGSGKSSLVLSLLRCINTEGSVLYNGIPTHSMPVDQLRSGITVIPQAPELLSGSLRRNLDLFGEHNDATLNDALRAAGLYSLQNGDGAKLTLDSNVSSFGGNLSVGQRQIIALARALLRQSKLVVLDEATSAIDHATDEIIQRSLKEELHSDVTVLIVAHRLRTVMDADKIMVLDAGRLVEFASPSQLLANNQSLFRALVEESGDKEQLLATVQ